MLNCSNFQAGESHDSCGAVVCIKPDCFPAVFLEIPDIPSFFSPSAWRWYFPGVVLGGVVILWAYFWHWKFGLFFSICLWFHLYWKSTEVLLPGPSQGSSASDSLCFFSAALNVHRNFLGTFIHQNFDFIKQQQPQPQGHRWWSPALQSSYLSMRRPLLLCPGSFVSLMAFAGEHSERTFGNHIICRADQP